MYDGCWVACVEGQGHNRQIRRTSQGHDHGHQDAVIDLAHLEFMLQGQRLEIEAGSHLDVATSQSLGHLDVATSQSLDHREIAVHQT